MRFKCTRCDEWHEGMPSFGANAPLFYYSIPVEARHDRCVLGSDTCVIDGQYFFVLGCLEIPVHGEAEPFSWGVWVSLSKDSFDQFVACFNAPKRSQVGPFFGWLSAELQLYPKLVRMCATTGCGRTSSSSPPITRLPWNNAPGSPSIGSRRFSLTTNTVKARRGPTLGRWPIRS